MSSKNLTESTQEHWKLAPESLLAAQTYLETLNLGEAARTLEISEDELTHQLNKKEVKRFIDAVFLDQGYLNRFKLQEKLTYIIDKKLEEMEDTELYSEKDIADLLALAHKMRMDEINAMIKADQTINKTTIAKQQNIQINDWGENYKNLLENLVTPK